MNPADAEWVIRPSTCQSRPLQWYLWWLALRCRCIVARWIPLHVHGVLYASYNDNKSDWEASCIVWHSEWVDQFGALWRNLAAKSLLFTRIKSRSQVHCIFLCWCSYNPICIQCLALQRSTMRYQAKAMLSIICRFLERHISTAQGELWKLKWSYTKVMFARHRTSFLSTWSIIKQGWLKMTDVKMTDQFAGRDYCKTGN